ncbi:MAG: c-type cytochrome biogenesis protein CcmI, partial [Pseudomonadota bacterium]
MLFWICAAALTLAALAPIFRATMNAAPREAARRAYDDRIAEIDADAAAGAMTAEDAETARTAAARRLLAAHGAEGTVRPLRFAGLAAAAAVFLAAPLALYLVIGSPGKPDAPLGARVAAVAAADPETLPPEDIILRLEAEARAAPRNAEAWDRLGRAYLALGVDKAPEAFLRAIETGGETPARLTDFAAALMARGEPQALKEAKAVLVRATEAAPGQWRAFMLLGVAHMQSGAP